MKKTFISVIIPQFNEEKNYSTELLTNAYNYLIKHLKNFEIIIVDDGSTDNSYELAKKFTKNKQNIQVIKAQHKGKPATLYQGLLKAKGEFCLLIDFDQSTPISEIQKLENYLDNYSCIIGSRGDVRNNSSIIRKLASKIFIFARKIILLKEIDDTQCGFKLIRRDLLLKVFPFLSINLHKQIKGWKVTAFDVELLYLINKLGFKIKEVSVKWNNNDQSVTKERKFIKESLEMIIQVIKIKINDFTKKYKDLLT